MYSIFNHWGHCNYFVSVNTMSSQCTCWVFDPLSPVLSMFNNEQRDIFLQIQYAILHNEPLLMFIDGKAGCGKTFLVNTLCAWIRSTARIILPTATSAFAAQLYPGGRTTHSTFGVSQHSVTKHLSNIC